MRSTRHCTRKVKRLGSSAIRPAPEAFAELVRSNSKLIYKMSLRILKNHSDAEDNLQNVLIKAYNNIHRFEGRSRLSSWPVRIAINEALMKIRKTQACRRCAADRGSDAGPELRGTENRGCSARFRAPVHRQRSRCESPSFLTISPSL